MIAGRGEGAQIHGHSPITCGKNPPLLFSSVYQSNILPVDNSCTPNALKQVENCVQPLQVLKRSIAETSGVGMMAFNKGLSRIDDESGALDTKAKRDGPFIMECKTAP
jgi:spore maturation protein SpmA